MPVIDPALMAAIFPKVVADSVVPVIFPPLRLAKVAKPVVVKVVPVMAPVDKEAKDNVPATPRLPVEVNEETVVSPAFNDPVEDTDDPVTAPADTPARVEVPATPKVPEEVKEATVEAPLFKEANEANPVVEIVVPVIFVEVIFARVDNPVPERVVRVTLAN